MDYKISENDNHDCSQSVRASTNEEEDNVYQDFDRLFTLSIESIGEDNHIDNLSNLKRFCKNVLTKKHDNFDFCDLIPKMMNQIETSEPIIAVIWIKIILVFDTHFHSKIEIYLSDFFIEFPLNLFSSQSISPEYMPTITKMFIKGLKNPNHKIYQKFNFDWIPFNEEEYTVEYLLMYVKLVKALASNKYPIENDINEIMKNSIEIHQIFENDGYDNEEYIECSNDLIEIFRLLVKIDPKFIENETLLSTTTKIWNNAFGVIDTPFIVHNILFFICEILQSTNNISIVLNIVTTDELVDLYLDNIDQTIKKSILLIFIFLVRIDYEIINDNGVQRFTRYVYQFVTREESMEFKRLILTFLSEILNYWKNFPDFSHEIMFSEGMGYNKLIEYLPDIIEMEDSVFTSLGIKMAMITIQNCPDMIEYFIEIFNEILEDDIEELDPLRLLLCPDEEN